MVGKSEFNVKYSLNNFIALDGHSKASKIRF